MCVEVVGVGDEDLLERDCRLETSGMVLPFAYRWPSMRLVSSPASAISRFTCTYVLPPGLRPSPRSTSAYETAPSTLEVAHVQPELRHPHPDAELAPRGPVQPHRGADILPAFGFGDRSSQVVVGPAPLPRHRDLPCRVAARPSRRVEHTGVTSDGTWIHEVHRHHPTWLPPHGSRHRPRPGSYMRSTSVGRTSPTPPLITTSASSSCGVGSRFTITTRAPAPRAIEGSHATG